MRLAPRVSAAQRRLRAAIENLESRQLMTAYLVDSEVALAAINNKDLNAGDIVMLKGGTTFGTKLSLDANDSGTATNPVIITSYDASTGLQLSDSAASSKRATVKTSSGDSMFLWDVSGVSIQNINVAGSGTNTSSGGSGINYWTDKATSNLTIHNVDASNFHGYGVLIGASNATLTNVTLTHINAYGNGDGIGTYAQGGKLIKNLYLGYSTTHDNPGLAGASDPTGGGIELGGVDGGTIEYNLSYHNGAAVNGPAGLGIWFYDSNNLTVQYNESHHNTTLARDGGGFDFDGGVTNSVMQYNYSHDNAGSGYGLYQYSGAPTWGGNIVRNNVSVNDGLKNNYAAIDVWSGDGTFGSVTVENNQVIKSDGRYIAYSSSTLVSKVTLLNNSFSTSGTADLTGIGLNGPAASTATASTGSTSTGTTSTSSTTTTTTPVTTTSSTSTTTTTPVVNTSTTSTSTTGTTTTTSTATTTTTTRKKKHHHHWA